MSPNALVVADVNVAPRSDQRLAECIVVTRPRLVLDMVLSPIKCLLSAVKQVNFRTKSSPCTVLYISSDEAKVDGFVRELTLQNDYTKTFCEIGS